MRRVRSLAIGRRASQQFWDVTAGKARHNSSNVRGVTAGKLGHNSSSSNRQSANLNSYINQLTVDSSIQRNEMYNAACYEME